MSLRAIRRARQRTARKDRAWLDMREHPDGSTLFVPGATLRTIMRRHGLAHDMGEAVLLLVCLRGSLDDEAYAELADAAERVLPGLPSAVWTDVDRLVANLDIEGLDKLHSFAEPLLKARAPMGSVLEALSR